MNRRTFLGAGGVFIAGLSFGRGAAMADRAHIRLVQDAATGFAGFVPVGLRVEPGTLITWENGSGVHTVTAYHPDNGGRPRRIPAGAEPWDSGYLITAGETFSRQFLVPGVYDYFCAPHERAGMAGRIVVVADEPDLDAPTLNAVVCDTGRTGHGVPRAVCARLPAVDRIMRLRRVRS
ncbi:MAG: plastocyanin/azurin family copper-binding protein [Halofilum sp. (in: g-proteobacteria)]|nr:plastocyanin/azurin family copper-binding protein [Halofilum sp. (in: g-proteobacteria)]